MPVPELDHNLSSVFNEVVRRNPGETEFHQAVREVLESLGPVVAKHPEYQGLVDKLAALYEEISRKGLENEKKGK